MPLNADTLVVNATLVTMDADRPTATAMALSGGRIVAVGDDSDVRRFRGAGTEVLDLAGGTVTPGLIDAHIHPFPGAVQTAGVDLGEVTTIDALLTALAAEAARLRACGAEWLRGWNLDYGVFDTRPAHADLIEAAVGGMPAFLEFFDGHGALVSHEALSRAGIRGSRSFSDRAEIVVDAAGRPTGDLHEDGAMRLVETLVPGLSPEEYRARIHAVLGDLNRTGITGGAVMNGTPADFLLYEELDAAGPGLPVRIVSALTHRPGDDEDRIRQHVALRDAGGDRWRGGVVKLFIDGVIDSGTGWLYEPDSRGCGTEPYWPTVEEYARTVERYAREGFQVATHAIGDRAVGETITAYERIGVASRSGAPHRIEHLETMTDADLRRLARLGITASVQPIHLGGLREDSSDSWSVRLGPERRARGWRTADVLAAGGPLALGSDWPVAQLDARVGMAWARLRRAPGIRNAVAFAPEQRLTGHQALHGFTVGAALAQGDGDELGMLAEGYAADFAVWPEDPRRVDPDELIGMPVRETWLDGRRVYAE